MQCSTANGNNLEQIVAVYKRLYFLDIEDPHFGYCMVLAETKRLTVEVHRIVRYFVVGRGNHPTKGKLQTTTLHGSLIS